VSWRFKQILFLLQIHHTINFPEFHIDWMSPEEVYMHRENASSQLYRGITASLGFKKPLGQRLFRPQSNKTFTAVIFYEYS
jgi:hypothetical protein